MIISEIMELGHIMQQGLEQARNNKFKIPAISSKNVDFSTKKDLTGMSDPPNKTCTLRGSN